MASNLGLKRDMPALKRCLGLREAVTITAGTVIGVGLFTVGANVAGMMGHTVILATLAALAVSIYPALLYAEMGAALPYAGGTYRYAREGLCPAAGMLAGWNFIISMVAVASGEALAFSFYIKTLLEALGVTLPFDDRLLACAAVTVFAAAGIRGVGLTGRMQNGFLFFFWGVAAVWVVTMLPELRFAGGTGGIPAGGFLPCVATVWWCFAGFETCCAMGEEIRYPQINLPRAMFLAPFIVFVVNGLFQWVLVCAVPPEGLAQLAAAEAPYAEGMRLAGITGFPLILLCMGIAFGGDFSTLNASVTAPARYLYTMARDGLLPGVFGRVHRRWQTPWTAIAVLGALMIGLVWTGSIVYIASLSLFATLLYYVVGIAAAWGLRRKRPHLARPYRAPLIAVGAPVSIAVYLVMMTQLDLGAVAAGAAWCVAGLAMMALCGRGRRAEPPADAPVPGPSEAEKRRMDREFRICAAAVAVLTAVILLLYGGLFLF